MKKLLGFLLLTFCFINAEAAVWETKVQWDQEWENKFNSWVAGPEWHRDFFVQSGPLQGLKLDCADAVYSMRIVFAAKHGLPFVIKDPTGGSSRISNQMSRWDSLAAGDRLRQFLKFVYGTTSTSSLPNDTYPVGISRETMGAGALILTDKKTRHTWTVKYLSEVGVPLTLSRSLPPTTRMFENYEFPPADYVFSGGMDPARNAGFRRFRQPAHIGKSVWEVPGYSTDQYKVEIGQWNDFMQAKLKLRDETIEERMARLLRAACQVANDRAVVVNLGDTYLANMTRTCMTDSEFYDYSTPSRDKRLRMTFNTFAREAKESQGKLSSNLQDKIDNVLAGEDSTTAASPYCLVKVGSGLTLTLGQIYERLINNQLSSSPHDTLKMRWGFESFPSVRAQRCGR